MRDLSRHAGFPCDNWHKHEDLLLVPFHEYPTIATRHMPFSIPQHHILLCYDDDRHGLDSYPDQPSAMCIRSWGRCNDARPAFFCLFLFLFWSSFKISTHGVTCVSPGLWWGKSHASGPDSLFSCCIKVGASSPDGQAIGHRTSSAWIV